MRSRAAAPARRRQPLPAAARSCAACARATCTASQPHGAPRPRARSAIADRRSTAADCRARASTSPGRTSQAVPAVIEHLADLLEIGRDDALPHRHVLEQLGRRSEERRAVRVRHVRRHEDVAGGEIRGALLLRNEAGEDGRVQRAAARSGSGARPAWSAPSPIISRRTALAQRRIIRSRTVDKRARQDLGAVPRPERADETDHDPRREGHTRSRTGPPSTSGR